MVGLGLTQLEIANLVGISDRTLRTRYRTELTNGAAEANMRVIASLFANATRHNNVAAQIWWTKCRAGWREAQTANGPGAGPVVYEFCWAGQEAPAQPAAKPLPQPTVIEADAVAAQPDVEVSEDGAETDGDDGGEVTVTWAGS